MMKTTKNKPDRKGFSFRILLSLLLKLIVIVFASTGVAICLGAGRGTFMGGSSVLMYYTIQSNILMVLLCLAGACLLISGKEISSRWYVIKYVGTLTITVTGAVFCLILAPTMGAQAWNPVNIYTHVIVPIACILDFFVVVVDASIRKRNVFYITIPPLLYVIYAGIGYVLGWEWAPGINYPYFFLNWGSPAGAFGFSSEFPFMGCFWWIFFFLIILLIIGLLFLLILDGIKKLSKRTSA